MPNASSLVRQLVEVRCRYTGETHSAVLPEIIRGLEPLTKDDRDCLLAALHDHDVLIQADLQSAVLPDAVTGEQQYLEAALFVAAGKVGGPVFRMVRPLADGIAVHVRPDALIPLLRGLLLGLAGLRLRRHRRHQELYLPGTSARVVLPAVAAARLAYLGEEFWPWLLRGPRPRADVQLCPWNAAASALLRRSSVFDTAWECTAAPPTCRVTWRDGLTTARVAALLAHRSWVCHCWAVDLPSSTWSSGWRWAASNSSALTWSGALSR
ncbi:hypothetical protein GCM10010174_89300 [Kutzneria viridogrisea]